MVWLHLFGLYSSDNGFIWEERSVKHCATSLCSIFVSSQRICMMQFSGICSGYLSRQNNNFYLDDSGIDISLHFTSSHGDAGAEVVSSD